MPRNKKHGTGLFAYIPSNQKYKYVDNNLVIVFTGPVVDKDVNSLARPFRIRLEV